MTIQNQLPEKQLDKESMKGTIYVLLSAVCFSTGGVLIKSIPWSSITIQGIRSIFSFMLIASYMVITKRKFVWNKTVLFGAVCNTAMALTFVFPAFYSPSHFTAFPAQAAQVPREK